MGGNPIQFDYTLILTIMLPVIISLIFFSFFVYLMVSAIKFFKHKATSDQMLLQKLNELIRLQTQDK